MINNHEGVGGPKSWKNDHSPWEDIDEDSVENIYHKISELAIFFSHFNDIPCSFTLIEYQPKSNNLMHPN